MPQDYTQAAFWYGKAANQGAVAAQRNLGLLYELGRGVPIDHSKAAMWYSRAASQYAEGTSVLQDYEQAAIWYRKAAEHGNAYAQLNLGCLYKEGLGVPQNDEHAANWIRRAIRNAPNDVLPIVQYNLGLLYLEGRGVTQDNVEAYFWLYLCAKTLGPNHKFAKARDAVGTKLTPVELPAVQKRANQWLDAHIEVLFC